MPKKTASLAQLQVASEPRTRDVELADGLSVTVRELSGRERFELVDKADDNRWDVMLWIASLALVDPLLSVEELDKLRPEFVKAIADAVMELSGVYEGAEDDAGKESVASDTGTSSPAT